VADPFDDLRLPDARAEAPDATFAARLRRRIEAELIPQLPPPARTLRRPNRATTNPRSTSVSTTETQAPAAATSALVPYLAVNDAAAAIDFYVEVFDVTETMRFTGDDGRIGHADLAGHGIHLMLSDEHPEMDVLGPLARGGASLALHLSVPDVDATYAAALDQGATALRQPADQSYGERSGDFVDPFGHRWMVSTPINQPSLDELNDSMDGFTVTAPATSGTEADTGDADMPDKVPGTFDHTGTGTEADPIELGYVTMGVGDSQRASRFFGQLFGWTAHAGSHGDEYAHVANTRFPIGLTPEGPNAAPILYFRVAAIEPFAARIEQLGGRVIDRNTYASGGNARCVDDQGNEFQLHAPAPGY